MKNKLGVIVRRNSKLVILLSVLSLPVMVLFQNCGKTQNVAMTDISGSNKAASITDTASLPLGTTEIDQTGSGSSQASSSDSSVSGNDVSLVDTVEDVDAENEKDLEEAISDCAALSLPNSAESNNVRGAGLVSEDKKSISGLRGKHVLSSDDFEGNTQIDLIDDSYGKLTLCGLDVKSITHSGGKLILIENSKVENVDSFHGEVFVIDGANAKLRNSKVSVHKK